MEQRARPSEKELNNKLRAAKVAIEAGNRHFANPVAAMADIQALEIGEAKEVWPLILSLLEEVKPPHYEGQRPPEKSYEQTIAGEDLFPFCWDSELRKERMYLKFAIKKEHFYFVSLHKSRYGGGQA